MTDSALCLFVGIVPTFYIFGLYDKNVLKILVTI